jgi:hypothetical protein
MALYSIEGCEFEFKCPKRWEELQAIEKKDARHCASCDKTVYLCEHELLLELHAQAGHCVAVPDPSRKKHYLGGAKMDYYPGPRLIWDED